MANQQFEALLREAGFVLDDGQIAAKQVARAVNDADREWHASRRVTHTHISRWRSGTVPRDKARVAIATALGRRLGRRVGLDELGWSAVGLRPDLGLAFPTSAAEGIDTAARLWQADHEEAHELLVSPPRFEAWATATLATRYGDPITVPPREGDQVGQADVAVIPAYVEAFDRLDAIHGGAHARVGLINFLRTSVAPMLRGSYAPQTGQELYSATAEALRLAAWMSYDTGHHGLAQRYFIQALWFANASGAPQVVGSVLDAMSHQATFLGHPAEAAQMVRAAMDATSRNRSHLTMAHFYAMEARALAQATDAHRCESALSRAASEFDAHRQSDDGLWVNYFDEYELTAEFAHCYLALGVPDKAIRYARQSLSAASGEQARSDFFVTMVLATALAAAGEHDDAASVAVQGLELGDSIRSDRCIEYVRQYRRLAPRNDELDERFATSMLWQASAQGNQ